MTIALIWMGTLAVGATLVGAIVTTIDGTNVCYINFRNQNQRIRECWNKIVKDIKDGELLLCLTMSTIIPESVLKIRFTPVCLLLFCLLQFYLLSFRLLKVFLLLRICSS